MSSIRSILVANRGEIAARVMRTAKSLGIRTIAVYSDADAGAPHVRAADDARALGGNTPAESYLDIDKVITAAIDAGADAIHPGYGFLSENAAFAARCAEAGLIFIGPPIEAIDIMGDKAKAKRRMIEAGVPCIPGYQGEDQSADVLVPEADKIGFPLMIKAAAGGGGKGMRFVDDMTAFEAGMELAKSEAQNAFGSSELILEKAIIRPRHIEIQVFADTHGNTIHFGERDCSVQRRHQKVIEEAPCPVMTDALRARMGEAAVRAARDVNYVGAGTVEFLLDADQNFYFLEMNTRLQVEHPVTEMIYGVDLVALQIAVANGEALPFAQEDLAITGHAVEVRLYAEDPSNDFLPSTGHVVRWTPPAGNGVRVDDGIRTGQDISPFYDPMVAKIIAHGPTRDAARLKLIAALESTAFYGVKSNRRFLVDALKDPTFAAGEATTAFIADMEAARQEQAAHEAGEPSSATIASVGALLFFLTRRAQNISRVPCLLLDWASASPIVMDFAFSRGDVTHEVSLIAKGHGNYQCTVEDMSIDLQLIEFTPTNLTVNIDRKRHSVPFGEEHAAPTIHFSLGHHDITLTDQFALRASDTQGADENAIIAPMHGMLVTLNAAVGDTVAQGTTLAVLEAMKMQHELTAPSAGTIKAVYGEEGAQIAADTLIIEIEPTE
ncbi:MAG: acetyl-CoA carboxylase biotin carboxylase subunit [Pseudomonadota bacterium]